jgi:ferredoxin
MDLTPYKLLAERLDSLPNGFPPARDGAELRLLAKIFSPEEARLAAQLSPEPETPGQIAARIGGDAAELRQSLGGMARRGLIKAQRAADGLAFSLMPFVVGIYEMQVNNLDEEFARLFEDYFQEVFAESLLVRPQFHRVIPVGESIRSTLEVRPFETAADLVNGARAWAVQDCICRKQKALIGDPCQHPVDICMALSSKPGAFDGSPALRALSQAEALATLRRAAEAGLVHSVSNNQKDVYYICNCCTCSCAILRGMARLGRANVVASSAFVNQVDEARCNGCGECVGTCQFNALAVVDDMAQVTGASCVGCGVCALACATEALGLVRRPEAEVLPIPATLADWGVQRALARGLQPEVAR